MPRKLDATRFDFCAGLTMTREEIEQRLRKVLVEQFALAPEHYTPAMRLAEDLDVDSLSRIDLAMALETEFGIEISDADAQNVTTIADASALLGRYLPER